MRPKGRSTSSVPPELAHYDHERWERIAREQAAPDEPSHRDALDLYFAALIAAGVDEDKARWLDADALVDDVKRRFGVRHA